MESFSSAQAQTMKRAGLYFRFSYDQNPETHGAELREFARQRGFSIVEEYIDFGSGAKSRRPALDRLFKEAARKRFDTVLVPSCDRIARSSNHLLQVVNRLMQLGIHFQSQKSPFDTDGPMAEAIALICSTLAETERALASEVVRAGMRRARLEGRRIGRTPLDVDRAALVKDRLAGMSLTATARKYGLSRASVVRLVKTASVAAPTADEVGQ